MSKKETYEAKTEQLLTPIAGRFGVEIYDVEYVREGSDWYLSAGRCRMCWMKKILLRMPIFWRSAVRGWAGRLRRIVIWRRAWGRKSS